MRTLGKGFLLAVAALGVTACGENQDAAQTTNATTPADSNANAASTMTEAQFLEQAKGYVARVSADDYNPATVTNALDQLSGLIADNQQAVPAAMRQLLPEDIQSARDALQANDTGALDAAATAMAGRLDDAGKAQTN